MPNKVGRGKSRPAGLINIRRIFNKSFEVGPRKRRERNFHKKAVNYHGAHIAFVLEEISRSRGR